MISEIAGRQHGRVARRQLLAAGVSRGQIVGRVRRGLLHVIHPGVYAVGHRAGGLEAELIGAWLYAGPASVVSHRGAARLWRLGRFAQCDLTAPATRRSRGPLVFHRARVPQEETTTRAGIRVTTPARTLLDLAGLLAAPRVQRLVTEAEVLGLVDQASLTRLLAAHSRRRGAPLLRRLLASDDRCRSHLEVAFRRLLSDRGLPHPEQNVLLDLDGYALEVDFLWRPARLVVEVDGRSTHHTLERFESDRDRDRRLAAAGWRVVRVTARQLRQRPAELGTDLAALLAGSS